MTRVRYAVVGLGHFAQSAILPAFAGAKRNSELVALISGDEAKRKELSAAYRVPISGSYEDYDALLKSGQFDAVYIAVPNALHADFAIRAAKAGLHVLCEKPLAVTVAECRKIIAASERAKVKLMCAYRLHFEASTLSAYELVENGELGDPKLYSSTFSQVVDPANTRFEPTREGGGPLYDVGVYCLNAARNLFGSEPIEVFAFVTPAKLGRDEVEEQAAVVMRFPDDKLATFSVSFVAAHDSRFQLSGDKGHLVAEPAFSHQGALSQVVTIDEKKTNKTFADRDQLAAELLHFSQCIIDDHRPEPSGDEGLRDVRVVEAILRSARTNRPVRLPKLKARPRPKRSLETFVPRSKRKPPQRGVAPPRK